MIGRSRNSFLWRCPWVVKRFPENPFRLSSGRPGSPLGDILLKYLASQVSQALSILPVPPWRIRPALPVASTSCPAWLAQGALTFASLACCLSLSQCQEAQRTTQGG